MNPGVNGLYQKEPELNIKNVEHLDCLRTPGRAIYDFLHYNYPTDRMQQDIIKEVMEKVFNWQESEEESEHKKEVLARLSEMVKQWSYEVAIQEHQPEMVAQQIQARLFTFGSYYLNVDTNDGDIDMVCVVPKLFQRELHFFNLLYNKIKAHPKTKYIQQVTGAKVPILKMEFDNIPIDISFAQLDAQSIQDDLDLTDNNVLVNMDENSCRSLNGRRVADRILQAVPNQQHFRQTLRMVKLWAKNKGIYSNVMGYLGGVSWAIMVAKVCQLFPSLSPFRLLYMFFEVYSQWDWPTTPVKLFEIEDLEDNPKNQENWLGKPEDLAKGKVFIITPSFPCMNSSHMITESSLIILKHLIFQAHLSLKTFQASPLLSHSQIHTFWNTFFTKIDFFNIYKNFIEIDILGNDEDDFKLWQGHVESKIRRLYLYFEKQYELNPPLIDIFDFHLYPSPFNKTDKQFPFCKTFFYSIRLKNTVQPNNQKIYADFKLPVSFFVKSLIEDKYFQRKKSTQNLRIFQIKRSQFKITNNEVITINHQQPLTTPVLNQVTTIVEPFTQFQPIHHFNDQVHKKIKQDNCYQDQHQTSVIQQPVEKQTLVKKVSYDSDESYLDKFQN